MLEDANTSCRCFWGWVMTMEGKALRSIVLVQAKTYFGLTNLVYNLRRVVFWQTRPFQASSEKKLKT